MDLQDSLAQARESTEMFVIKEEVIDDCGFNEYMLNLSFGDGEIKPEPGIFVMSNNNISTEEDNKFSLSLANDDNKFLNHFTQKKIHSSLSDEQMKKKRRNKNKLKNGKRKEKLPQKTAEIIKETGRISRDEMFKNQEYECRLCQKSFLGRKCFKSHFKVHLTICQNGYSCHFCNYTSKTTSHINRHLLERHFLQDQKDIVEKCFPCTICELRFYAKKDLERHMFVHTREGNLKCSKCDFSCTKKCNMETHLSLYHGYPRVKQSSARSKKDDSIFKCHYCSYTSDEKTRLRKHIDKHLGIKKLKCPQCSYMCNVTSDMQKHCTTHSDERPFICFRCNRSFKRRSHILIHFNRKTSCRS